MARVLPPNRLVRKGSARLFDCLYDNILGIICQYDYLDAIRLNNFAKKEGESLPLLDGPVPHVAARPLSGEPLGRAERISALEVLQELGAAENVHTAGQIDNDRLRHSSTSRGGALLSPVPLDCLYDSTWQGKSQDCNLDAIRLNGFFNKKSEVRPSLQLPLSESPIATLLFGQV